MKKTYNLYRIYYILLNVSTVIQKAQTNVLLLIRASDQTSLQDMDKHCIVSFNLKVVGLKSANV